MSASVDHLDGPPLAISLATSIAGVPLRKVLLNSSNPSATSLEQLLALDASPATGAFTTRTACPGFVHDDSIHQWKEMNNSGNTINCFGYSSQSFDFYCDAIQEVQRSGTGKPAIMSVSGKAPQVASLIKTLGDRFHKSESFLVEINLSCPNFPDKPPIAYDFEAMEDFLKVVFAQGSFGLKIGVKTTPYFYDAQFIKASEVINSFAEQICFVTCINTLGNGLYIDIESESPVLPAVYGGLGGPAVHATALANVRKLRKLLRPETDIIAAGGADSGEAAFRFLLCGASAVCMASSVLTQDISVFEKIEAELISIMKRKGYQSIAEFKGNLKD